MIARRLTHLSDECNRVLVLASVLGREFALDALARMGGVSEDELLDTLDEAMAARVVSDVPGGPGRLRFAHVLIRDTLYEGLTSSPPRAAAQAGSARRSRRSTASEPGPHLAELAHHSIAGSDFDKGVALRPARRRPRARAARLRGGCAPLRDGARRARARATLATSRRAASSCSRSARRRRGRGTPRPRREPSSTPPEIARRLGLARELAPRGGRLRRALHVGAGRRATSGSCRCSRRALAALAEEDVELRARLLARLAGALRDEHSRDRRDRLSREAVELARRAGNPAALAYALDGRRRRHQRPRTRSPSASRSATELREVAERIGDTERVANALDHRRIAQLMAGDLREAEVALAAESRIADELRQPAQLWQVYSARAMLALAAGRLTEAEELVPQAFAFGERALPDSGDPRLPAPAATRSATSRDASRRSRRRSATWSPSTRPARSSAARSPMSTHGSDGVPEAKRALDDLARDDFSALPFDQEWLYGMSLLAETSALLGDTDSAAVLYRLLVPWAAFNAADHPEGIRGSVSRYLGLLATTTRRWDEAERHFEAALAMNAADGRSPLARPHRSTTTRECCTPVTVPAIASAPRSCSTRR